MCMRPRYGYYLAAAMGVRVPRAVKKAVTSVQLVQFGLFFAHALFGMLIAKHYRPRIVVVLCIFQAVVFASLFGHFFWCAACTVMRPRDPPQNPRSCPGSCMREYVPCPLQLRCCCRHAYVSNGKLQPVRVNGEVSGKVRNGALGAKGH